MIIDFGGRKFCFKPNHNFKNPFNYNIAGIEVAQAYDVLPQAEVINVWKNSPADKAGLKTGDIITMINREWIYAMNITQVRAFFERPSSQPLIITYQRNSESFEVKINMNPKI